LADASLFSAIDVFMIRPLDFELADNLVVVEHGPRAG
jgi:hypothetical protein